MAQKLTFIHQLLHSYLKKQKKKLGCKTYT